MKVRGRLQEGMVADITIFDPKEVKEGSTYKAGQQGLPPVGMPHVIVNGVFVKKDNKATDKFPGQPIRYPVEDKPRHIPASQKQWLKTFTIDGSAVAPKTEKRRANDGAAAPSKATGSAWWGDKSHVALGNCCEWHTLNASR